MNLDVNGCNSANVHNELLCSYFFTFQLLLSGLFCLSGQGVFHWVWLNGPKQTCVMVEQCLSVYCLFYM